jgi:prepilin-type N-terminal cleavage/methylation domain-containing protein
MNAPLVHLESAGTRGFSLAELTIAMALAAVGMSMAIRPLSRTLGHERINRSANVVAADLELALSLAGRQRRPLRVTFDSTAIQYTITNRLDGTVYQRRSLGLQSEFTLSRARFQPATLDVFPSGMTSGPLTVTLGSGAYTRQVTMTRAGLIRIP